MVNANIYMHDSDRAALQALKAIPGFTQLLKAYMKVWNERQFRVANMSGKLRISEKQMPKYYDMLPPICEKLGIKVPELYLKLDVEPNSYTYGYTKPFIVLTSGMLETVPDDLIPTILAHECGHIACRHTMFTTMGNMILNGMVLSGGVAALATTPVKVAFAYWMRCSEFSADRAAMICDGSPDKMMEVCMRLAGYDKDIIADASMDAFLEQADEYREMVKTNKWDKTMEFIQYYQNDHPLTAVRAYECREWSKTETFKKIIRYNLSDDDMLPDNDSLPREIPMDEPSKYYVGKNYEEVMDLLIDAGFTSIETVRSTDKGLFTKSGQTLSIRIDGDDSFDKGAWYPEDADIKLIYYEAETPDEIAASHEGMIQVPDSSKHYIGRLYKEVKDELSDAGFSVFIPETQEVKKGRGTKPARIVKIAINGQTKFDKGDWFEPEAKIRITFQKVIN